MAGLLQRVSPARLIEQQNAVGKWGDLFMQIPYHDEVEAAFDDSKERLRLQNYRDDLYWQKLKRAL